MGNHPKQLKRGRVKADIVCTDVSALWALVSIHLANKSVSQSNHKSFKTLRM